MGNCCFPLYITPDMAGEWFEIWRLMSTWSVHHNDWSLSSSLMDVAALHPALLIFRAVVERNLGRARRRYLRACGTPMDDGYVMPEGGAVMPELSDDEHIPGGDISR